MRFQSNKHDWTFLSGSWYADFTPCRDLAKESKRRETCTVAEAMADECCFPKIWFNSDYSDPKPHFSVHSQFLMQKWYRDLPIWGQSCTRAVISCESVKVAVKYQVLQIAMSEFPICLLMFDQIHDIALFENRVPSYWLFIIYHHVLRILMNTNWGYIPSPIFQQLYTNYDIIYGLVYFSNNYIPIIDVLCKIMDRW